ESRKHLITLDTGLRRYDKIGGFVTLCKRLGLKKSSLTMEKRKHLCKAVRQFMEVLHAGTKKNSETGKH
ncbi:MAG: hypothetical protein JW902_16770, partial [Syntrophaceae bacterium]|nr:hypothetical protein [Syntrophaceae bacterium]